MAAKPSNKKRTPSIELQKKALKAYVLRTPIEEIFLEKNLKAVEVLKRAGLLNSKQDNP